jgi:Ser/Thr protein kinase RdoA (MazF antagonist)
MPTFPGALSLVHGDIQPNNVMFQKRKDGGISDKIVALIDWQILFHGWF